MDILFLLSKRRLRLQSDLIRTCQFLHWEIKFGNKRPVNVEDKGTAISKIGHKSQVNTD